MPQEPTKTTKRAGRPPKSKSPVATTIKQSRKPEDMKEAEDVSEVSSFKTKKMDHFLDDQDYKLEEADGLDELDDLGDDELADDIDAIKTKREYDEDVA